AGSLPSVSEIQTVEVQSGGEVTLLCSNISTYQTQTDWFRVVNRTKPRCISSMFDSGGEASPCHGFNNGFEMSSNTSTVFLKIKQVKLSDSGLYFCGFYIDRNTVIGDATHLNVQGELDGTKNLVTVILGGLTVFFSIAVTVLTVKIRKLQKEESDRISKLTSVFLGGLSAFLIMVIIGLVVKNRKLQSEESDRIAKLTSVFLGGLSAFLVMVIIGLVVKNRKFQSANKEEQNQEQTEIDKINTEKSSQLFKLSSWIPVTLSAIGLRRFISIMTGSLLQCQSLRLWSKAIIFLVRELDGTKNLVTVILGGLTVFFSIAVTVLTVKIRKLQKAADEDLHPKRKKKKPEEEPQMRDPSPWDGQTCNRCHILCSYLDDLTFDIGLVGQHQYWISASVSEPETVEVHPGGEVTLLCSNLTNTESTTFWFRLVQRHKMSCISTMMKPDKKASFCDGFKNGNFDMRFNKSSLSLNIKQVNISDFGLYFCGFFEKGHLHFRVKHLKLRGSDEPHVDLNSQCAKESDRMSKLTSVFLGGLSAFLVMVIIGLVVKNRKIQSGELDGTKNLVTVILGGLTVFFSIAVTVLTVKIRKLQKEPEGITKLLIMILGGLTVFFAIVIIVLVVQNCKLRKAARAEQNTQADESAIHGDYEVSNGVTKQTPLMFDGVTTLTIVILGALMLFLIIIVICLVVKIRTFPKASLGNKYHGSFPVLESYLKVQGKIVEKFKKFVMEPLIGKALGSTVHDVGKHMKMARRPVEPLWKLTVQTEALWKSDQKLGIQTTEIRVGISRECRHKETQRVQVGLWQRQVTGTHRVQGGHWQGPHGLEADCPQGQPTGAQSVQAPCQRTQPDGESDDGVSGTANGESAAGVGWATNGEDPDGTAGGSIELDNTVPGALGSTVPDVGTPLPQCPSFDPMKMARLVNNTQPCCISSMYTSTEPAKFCDGYENGKIEVRSNTSTLFLKIKQVDLSDSGLYFCGYLITKNPLILDATYLQVQEVFSGTIQSLILGGLIVFLVIVVFCLAVKIKKLQKAHGEEQTQPHNKLCEMSDGKRCHSQSQGSDDVNYAAVTFHRRTKKNPGLHQKKWRLFILLPDRLRKHLELELEVKLNILTQKCCCCFILSSLLLVSGWISVSGSESQVVEVQSGENVLLRCSNISKSPTHAFWSRLVNRTEISCISSTYGSYDSVNFCDGLKTRKFEMGSNISTVSLKIQQVDLSDSGMYFCGFYTGGHTLMNVIHLNVLKVQGDDKSYDDAEDECKRGSDGITKMTRGLLSSLAVFLSMVIIGLVVKNRELQTGDDKSYNDKDECKEESDRITKMTSVILGVATVFLIVVIIVLIIKVRKLQTAQNEEQSPAADELNYAALSFHPKAKENRRPVSERELEPNVVYAATR
ncbi:hypothetical protein L3Q82_017034, partial [Scortum barcoo]